MRVPRTGQYAIQALLALAETGAATVSEITERTGVPEPFLHQMVSPLKEAGLVRAKRGPGGGLILAAPLESVTLLAVLHAVGLREELDESQWTRVLPHPHRSRLEGIERLLPDELGLLTLADLMPRSGQLSTDPQGYELGMPAILPPRKLLDFIGNQGVSVTNADRCAIYFGGGKYGYVTTAVETRPDVAVTLPESSERLTETWVPQQPVGAVAAAWVTGLQVVINDTQADERASPEIAKRFKIRSVMATPIHAGRNGSGVLVLAKQAPNAWRPGDLERASELATIAGFAILGHESAGIDQPVDNAVLEPQAQVAEVDAS